MFARETQITIINHAQILSGKRKKKRCSHLFLIPSSLLCFNMSNVPKVPGSTVAARLEIYPKPEPK